MRKGWIFCGLVFFGNKLGEQIFVEVFQIVFYYYMNIVD